MILAAIVHVATATELTTAIDNAMPGDEIVLADGTYALTANVTCDAAGTEAEPITVRAASALGAHITAQFLAAKREEWRDYISQVSAWELERYLAKY